MKILSTSLYGYLYSEILTSDLVTYELYTPHTLYSAIQCTQYTVYTLPMYNIYSVTIYVHSVITQYTQYHHVYGHYSAAIYDTSTVLHCIVTLCSPYKIPVCNVNTVSLILINYAAYKLSL